MTWLLFALAFGLIALTNWRLWRLRPCHLSLQFAFSRQRFLAIVDRWREQGGLQRYRSLLLTDFATLTCYGAAGFLWVSEGRLFDGMTTTGRSALSLLLPLAAAADAMENLLQLRLTTPGRQDCADIAYAASGLASMAKWGFTAAFTVWTLVLCAAK